MLCICGYPWRGIWHRPQQTVVRIKQYYTVLYLTPRYVKDMVKGEIRSCTASLDIIDERIAILEPVLLSGEDSFFILRWLNRWILNAYLRETIPHSRVDILWFNNPKYSYLCDVIEHEILVYDILDEYSGFEWSRRGFSIGERYILSKADLVFAGTRELYERKKPMARGEINLLPCGVEFEHFNRAAFLQTRLPQDISQVPHPIIGYFGMVDERIDQQLIEKVAKKRPEWQFFLIGPIIGDFSGLLSLPNVHLVGARDYAQLPSYMAAFDVCSIPFVLNKITMHINPTKILEYMAGGKPVVSPAIPDVVRYYGELVYIYSDADDFIDKVEGILGEPDTNRLSEGMRVAKERSWERYAQFILERLKAISKVR